MRNTFGKKSERISVKATHAKREACRWPGSSLQTDEWDSNFPMAPENSTGLLRSGEPANRSPNKNQVGSHDGTSKGTTHPTGQDGLCVFGTAASNGRSLSERLRLGARRSKTSRARHINERELCKEETDHKRQC